MDVLRPQREGLLAGDEGFVVLAGGEMYLGLGEPGFEAGRIGRDRCRQLSEGARFVAHGEVEGRLVGQGQGAR